MPAGAVKQPFMRPFLKTAKSVKEESATKLLTLIGFGEAAYHMAKGLTSEGMSGITAYDRMQDSAERGAFIRQRAGELGVTLAESCEEACRDSKFVLSLTSANVALSVAEEALPYMARGAVYVDMNAAGPQVKKSLSELPNPQGIGLCDCAVMGPVPQRGHQTAMLLSGDGAAAFLAAMRPFHMNLTLLDAPLGGASAIKMFRSVVLKGLPQLLFEAMLPARKYGVLDTLISSLNDTLANTTVEKWCDLFINRTVLHAARRAHEMEDVISTIQEMGLDASMSVSARSRLLHLAKLNLASAMEASGDLSYLKTIDMLLEKGDNQ